MIPSPMNPTDDDGDDDGDIFDIIDEEKEK